MKVRFIVDGTAVDRDIVINNPRHDFYFTLVKEPSIVRFDPEFSVLADVTFNKSAEMLCAQLKDSSNVIGRLLTVKELKKKDDKKSIDALKDALNNDPFFGVRKEASLALREIHTDDAFNSLIESAEQSDARIRLQVVGDIGKFYRAESLEFTRRVIDEEKNPDILASAIRNLGRYNMKETKRTLTGFLKSKSYRNRVADAAIAAIRMLGDPSYSKSLKKTIESRENEFTSQGFAQALNTLAHIVRDEDDRSDVRKFLAGYVNHPKRRISEGAIFALGTLGDSHAIPIVETFSGDDSGDRVQRTAKEALRKLREQKKIVPEEIQSLREKVDELQKESEDVKKDLDDLKKRFEAKEEGEKKSDDE